MRSRAYYSLQVNQREVDSIADRVISEMITTGGDIDRQNQLIEIFVSARFKDHPLYSAYLNEVRHRVLVEQDRIRRAEEVRQLRFMIEDARRHVQKYGYVDDDIDEEVDVPEVRLGRKIR